MNGIVDVVQKKSKNFVKVIRVMMAANVITLVCLLGVFIFIGTKSKEAFTVKEYVDDLGDTNYLLKIGNKEWTTIALENYQIDQESGERNLKASCLIEVAVSFTSLIILFFIFMIVERMLYEVSMDFRPFTAKNTKRLRQISILILAITLIPGWMELMLNFFIFLKASMIISPINFIVIALSGAIWGVSYVMEYGAALQEEVDEML